MNAFNIGISAIATANRSLDLIGQNISNAATPGYHRQAVNLVSQTVNGVYGTGVDVASITRYTDAATRTAILRGNADQGSVSARLDVNRQVDATLGAGSTGGVGGLLENFFNQVSQLTTQPDQAAARRPVVTAASDLARQFNASSADLDTLRNDVGSQITQTVAQINDYAARIADLNGRIASIESTGGQANDLHDQRDQLIDQLSGLVDVRTIDQPNGVVNVLATGAPVVVGELATKFQVSPNPSGNIDITQPGSAQPIGFASGQLSGLLQEYNTDLPAAKARLDGVAGELARQVNEAHATGLGLNGPLTTTQSTNPATSSVAPLNAAGLPFPIAAGPQTLTVSVTDSAGNRTNTTIAYDSSVNSLQDLATSLSGVPGLSASVDPTTNALTINAQAGYSFDFAGRDTNPPGGGAVANTDTGGLLAALGVNGLFTGSTANGIAVRPDIVADPNLLASSRDGNSGDGSNLERIAAVRDVPSISGRTLGDEYTDLATSVGSNVNTLDDQQTAQAALLQNLNAQEQSVTGVDTNEELVHLMDFQRMIEGASKYMSAVNTALDSVLNIIQQ